MLKYLLIPIFLFATACGDIDVSDSRHDVVHSVEFGDLPNTAKEICEDRYPIHTTNREALVAKCTTEIVSDLLDAVGGKSDD